MREIGYPGCVEQGTLGAWNRVPYVCGIGYPGCVE